MPPFGRPTPEDHQRAMAYRDWLRRQHPFAIASLVLGIFSLIEFGALLVFGIASIVLGVMAIQKLNHRRAGPGEGRKLAWTGIILSAISLVIAAGLYSGAFHFLSHRRAMTCVLIVGLVCTAVMTLVTLLRWFEQITEAVDQGWWNKVLILIIVPPAVWFFPSRTFASRPIPVPRHEPVRGFGTAPLAPKPLPDPKAIKKKKPAVDPAQIAKLWEKMRQQGMLGPENPAEEEPKKAADDKPSDANE